MQTLRLFRAIKVIYPIIFFVVKFATGCPTSFPLFRIIMKKYKKNPYIYLSFPCAYIPSKNFTNITTNCKTNKQPTQMTHIIKSVIKQPLNTLLAALNRHTYSTMKSRKITRNKTSLARSQPRSCMQH